VVSKNGLAISVFFKVGNLKYNIEMAVSTRSSILQILFGKKLTLIWLYLNLSFLINSGSILIRNITDFHLGYQGNSNCLKRHMGFKIFSSSEAARGQKVVTEIHGITIR
jgi:hypothetical protein